MIAELRAFKYSNDLASEVFANAKTMIVYGGQRKEIIRFKKELNREFGKVTNWSFAQACVIFVYWVITFLAWGVVMWFGIANVLVVPHDLTCILSSSPYYVLDAGDMFIVMQFETKLLLSRMEDTTNSWINLYIYSPSSAFYLELETFV